MIDTTSLNELTKYHLELMERIRELRDELYSHDLLLENATFKASTISQIVPINVIEDYDPNTDKEVVKTINQKIVEIETWYIVLDSTKSIMLDNNFRSIINKHGFEYGHILNQPDSNELLIQLKDKNKEKE